MGISQENVPIYNIHATHIPTLYSQNSGILPGFRGTPILYPRLGFPWHGVDDNNLYRPSRQGLGSVETFMVLGFINS